jgi:UDP-N-acetyl-D-mannosaminuronate dehydrogenase
VPLGDRIVVLGLGYVGLPLAVALARNFDVTGFDIDEERVAGLEAGYDRTAVVSSESLAASSIRLTRDPEECRSANIYIVTVPTPLNGSNKPDLSWLLDATRMVASSIDPLKRPTIVYESTVYPGVTEDVCGPEIERVSGLQRGRDFRLGYSPERVNPGDPEHTIDKIPKVVAGEDKEVTDQLHSRRGKAGTALVLGLTFKENVPDLRNSRSFDLVARLQELGHEVSVSDPIADGVEVSRDHGLSLIDAGDQRFDLVVGAVAHQAYREMGSKRLEALLNPGGTLADLRGMWRTAALDPDVDRWTL